MTDYIIYAIADVHGRADLLLKTVAYAVADAAFYKRRPVFYFLGDIVDRGPESRLALATVVSTLEKYPGSKLHLGNHDKWFLDAVATGGRHEETDDWLGNGGRTTLRSFFPDRSFAYPEPDIRKSLAELRDNLPPEIAVIRDAALITRHGSIAFCHAGVDRTRALSQQDLHTLTWIRRGFLDEVDSKAAVIVHGHTIYEYGPIITENRISLDTGAYMTDKLTTCRIDPSRREISFFQCQGHGTFGDVEEIEGRYRDRDQGTIKDRLTEIFDNWTDAE